MRYPDSQAGHFRSFQLSTFPASNDEQGNSSDQHQAAEYGWNGDPVMIFPSGVDGPKIKKPFLMGVAESLISEGQAAQNN